MRVVRAAAFVVVVVLRLALTGKAWFGRNEQHKTDYCSSASSLFARNYASRWRAPRHHGVTAGLTGSRNPLRFGVRGLLRRPRSEGGGQGGE